MKKKIHWKEFLKKYKFGKAILTIQRSDLVDGMTYRFELKIGYELLSISKIILRAEKDFKKYIIEDMKKEIRSHGQKRILQKLLQDAEN